jgi:predicted Rdx family selenoprotein
MASNPRVEIEYCTGTEWLLRAAGLTKGGER